MWNGKDNYYEAFRYLPEVELDRYEMHRFISLKNFPNKNISPLLLANLGVKYEGNETSVKCVFCEKETSLNDEKWNVLMKDELRELLHDSNSPCYKDIHPLSIRCRQGIEENGKETLANLKRQERVGLSEKKVSEYRQRGRKRHPKGKMEQLGAFELKKALCRMCPCDPCVERFQEDNLDVAATKPFFVNPVTNTMAGHLRNLIKRSEESQLIEMIYHRQRGIFDRDESFVKTGKVIFKLQRRILTYILVHTL